MSLWRKHVRPILHRLKRKPFYNRTVMQTDTSDVMERQDYTHFESRAVNRRKGEDIGETGEVSVEKGTDIFA